MVGLTGSGVAAPKRVQTGCSAAGGAPTTWPIGLVLLVGALGLAAAAPRVRRALRRR